MSRRGTRTVDACLERLPAHFASEVTRAALLVELHRHRVFVIAEETLERRRQRLALRRGQPEPLQSL